MSTARLLPLMGMLFSTAVTAEGYELLYLESEPGIEPYTSRILIDDRYLRVDDLSDESGFILYDHELRKVFSVSHHNRSTLVIAAGDKAMRAPVEDVSIEESKLEDAPRISGRTVHDHRVVHRMGERVITCTSIQYVPGLLTTAGKMMHAYQSALVANQLRSLEGTPIEFQTPCMLSDQIYFDGAIYNDGIPISEQRSNGRQRALQNWRETEIDAELFSLPGYRQFSLE